MPKRFYSLSFIIGLLFFLLAIILLSIYVTSSVTRQSIHLYTGIVYGVFGGIMMMIPPHPENDPEG